MSETSIQWCDHSINPLRFGKGHYCQKISPGCTNCYASALQPRFGNQGFGGTGSVVPHRVNDQRDGGLWLDESKLQEVLRRKKPTKYFWCDMTDLFGSWVPDEWIDLCFAVMALTPQHTHQVLTKRPERMLDYSCDFFATRIFLAMEAITPGWSVKGFGSPEHGRCVPVPIPNVWLGVSVENQATKARIDVLRQTPAAVRFLSLEPLLEDLGAMDLTGIDWCIIGGESGRQARPMDLAWVRSLIHQCKEANCPVFVKQLGANPVDAEHFEANAVLFEQQWGFPPTLPECRLKLHDSHGGDMVEWPNDLRVREFP